MQLVIAEKPSVAKSIADVWKTEANETVGSTIL